MSIFKTDVAEKLSLTTDQVVSAAVKPEVEQHLPGFMRTSQLDTQHVSPGAVRRKGNQ